MEHRLKTVQPFFDDIKKGKKPFEIRFNDRNYQVGDFLILEEYETTKGYSGQMIRKEVTYVLKDCPNFGLMKGYCILGIKDIYEPYSAEDSCFDNEYNKKK